jgi:formylglycine-generating enzyme
MPISLQKSNLLIVVAFCLLAFWGCSENPAAPQAAPIYPEMILITGGTFTMGSSDTSLDGSDVSPPHQVTISSFYIDKYDETQVAYLGFMRTNPSHFSGDLNRPVDNVTWFNAVRYCIKRSTGENLQNCYDTSDASNWTCDITKNGYRLPTEAEWEYTCRAGTVSGYYWGGHH